jgi:hypothetical protein
VSRLAARGHAHPPDPPAHARIALSRASAAAKTSGLPSVRHRGSLGKDRHLEEEGERPTDRERSPHRADRLAPQ